MDDPIKNFTETSDPNVVIGRHGARITRQDFETANKNGYAWKDFPAYADYIGSWAHPITEPTQFHPIYRAYAQKEPISGADIALLSAKNDPSINAMIKRNIAPQGQVPMFGSQDADNIKALIASEKVTAINSNHPDVGIYNAMNNAMKK
jgi:hypothetical protein